MNGMIPLKLNVFLGKKYTTEVIIGIPQKIEAYKGKNEEWSDDYNITVVIIPLNDSGYMQILYKDKDVFINTDFYPPQDCSNPYWLSDTNRSMIARRAAYSALTCDSNFIEITEYYKMQLKSGEYRWGVAESFGLPNPMMYGGSGEIIPKMTKVR